MNHKDINRDFRIKCASSLKMMTMAIALIALVMTAGKPNIAFAQDSLPWKGVIVFEDWVRVDDAPGLSGHNANHPQMIMDKNVVMYAVWQDDRDNDGFHNIYFSKSADTGKTWSANISLSSGLPANFDNRYPWIAADDSSRLYVVWQRESPGNAWQVYFSRSVDGGVSFTAPDTIKGVTMSNSTSSNINSGPQPRIVADMTMDTIYLYLAWVDDGSGVLRIDFARSVDLGDLFGNQLTIDNNATNINREPFLAVDDSGNVHCVWRRGTGGTSQDPKPFIGYNKSTDRGVSFMASDVIVNDTTIQNSYRGNPIVAVNNSNGNVLVAFEDSRRTNDPHPDIFWSRSTDQGLTFSQNKRVNYFTDTSAAYENRKPSISIDPQGIAVVAWHDNSTPAGHFGIHLAAYSDTIGSFGQATSLFDTYTEDNSGAFGTNLYPPSLYVTVIDSVTNFFLVWQDFYEDSSGGNIYSVRGWVVEVLADLDVDNDSLDVHGDTLDLRAQPAGPAYSPFAKGAFVLANTDALYNPDSIDGPSLSRVDSITASCSLDSVFVLNLPASLSVGQTVICTLAVVIPVNTAPGTFIGTALVSGVDSLGAPVEETFIVRYYGPQPRGSLDSLEVVPIPFKPGRNPEHDAIHFQGLAADSRVKIYDLAGALVWDSADNPADDAADGHIAWEADVASGIYIYLVTAPNGEHKKGKLSVIK